MNNHILGNKIVIVGVSASGKSTFSRKLSERIKLPLTLMDSIMWKPGWQYVGDKETVRQLDAVSKTSEWIIEGYISMKARTFILERADTVIYLDYSPFVSTWRYVRRWFTHRNDPRPELEGSPEKFSFAFLKLVWTKGEAKSLNNFLAEIADKSKIIKFYSPKEANDFIAQI